MAIPSLNASVCIGKPVAIYALMDPRDSTAFYVGATTKRLCTRLASHVNDARHLQMRGPRYDHIRSIESDGSRTEIVDLEISPFQSWPEAEQFWIEYLRFLGARLTNIGAGGAGALGSRQTEETRLRRQSAAAGRDMSRAHAPEARLKAMQSVRHKIEVDGVVYSGIKAASAALGIPYSTLHYRIDVGIAKRLTPRRNGNTRKRKGGPRRGARNPNSRPVIIDGTRHVSITAAAAALGKDHGTIVRWLSTGKAQHAVY